MQMIQVNNLDDCIFLIKQIKSGKKMHFSKYNRIDVMLSIEYDFVAGEYWIKKFRPATGEMSIDRINENDVTNMIYEYRTGINTGYLMD